MTKVTGFLTTSELLQPPYLCSLEQKSLRIATDSVSLELDGAIPLREGTSLVRQSNQFSPLLPTMCFRFRPFYASRCHSLAELFYDILRSRKID